MYSDVSESTNELHSNVYIPRFQAKVRRSTWTTSMRCRYQRAMNTLHMCIYLSISISISMYSVFR